MVDEAHARKRKTAAHAHGATGAKRAILAGIDSIEHGSFLDEEGFKLMKARGTVYIPTLMALEGVKERMASFPPQIAEKARAATARVGATVRMAIGMGVKIGLGTDAAVYPHGRNAEEFRHLVELGMKPAQALGAGTRVDAELFGLGSTLGSLESGKLADVVAVPEIHPGHHPHRARAVRDEGRRHLPQRPRGGADTGGGGRAAQVSAEPPGHAASAGVCWWR